MQLYWASVIYYNSSNPVLRKRGPGDIYHTRSMNDVNAPEVPAFHDYIDQYAAGTKEDMSKRNGGSIKAFDTRVSNEYPW